MDKGTLMNTPTPEGPTRPLTNHPRICVWCQQSVGDYFEHFDNGWTCEQFSTPPLPPSGESPCICRFDLAMMHTECPIHGAAAKRLSSAQEPTVPPGTGESVAGHLSGRSETQPSTEAVSASSGRFFSYDPDGGFDTHDTAQQAEERAQNYFAIAESAASDDGWPPNTDQICWGKIIGEVLLSETKQRPPESELDENGCDHEGLSWQDFEVWEKRELRTTPPPSCAPSAAGESIKPMFPDEMEYPKLSDFQAMDASTVPPTGTDLATTSGAFVAVGAADHGERSKTDAEAWAKFIDQKEHRDVGLLRMAFKAGLAQRDSQLEAITSDLATAREERDVIAQEAAEEVQVLTEQRDTARAEITALQLKCEAADRLALGAIADSAASALEIARLARELDYERDHTHGSGENSMPSWMEMRDSLNAQRQATESVIAALATACEQIKTLGSALKDAVRIFRNYAALHTAKGTLDGYTKAESNLATAQRFQDILAAASTPAADQGGSEEGQ